MGRLLIQSFAGPTAWAKRREFVIKERLIDPVKPIVGEWNREVIDQGGILQTRPRPLRDRLHELRTDGVAQNIASTVSK